MGFNSNRRWLWLAILLAGLTSRSCFAAELLPKADVYALIVGVSNYKANDPMPVGDAAAGAERFKALILRTYGTNAVRWYLTNELASARSVRRALREVRNLPPGSLLLVYFSGHGVRDIYANNRYPGDHYLRLYGSTATDFAGDSILVDELWQCLLPTQMTTALIFLDCCYAVPETVTIKIARENLSRLDVRVFALGACSRNETATGGVFTPALEAAFGNPNLDCITPVDLLEMVKSKLPPNSGMTPDFAFDSGVARCFAELREPAALLAFTFPRETEEKLTFWFNGKKDPRVFDRSERVFVRQATLDRSVDVRITDAVSNSVYKTNITVRGPRRIIEIPVTLSSNYWAVQSNPLNDFAESRLELAMAAEAFSASSGDWFFSAAKAKIRANGSTEVGAMLRKAASLSPENSIYQVCASDPTALIDRRLHSLISEFGGDSLLTTLESVGRYDLAAAISKTLEDAALTREDKAAFAIRASANTKLSGQTNIHSILASIDLQHLSPHLDVTLKIAETSAPELAVYWSQAPKSLAQWLTLKYRPEASFFESLKAGKLGEITAEDVSSAFVGLDVTSLSGAALTNWIASKAGFYVNYSRGRLWVTKGTTPKMETAAQVVLTNAGPFSMPVAAPDLVTAVEYSVANPDFETELRDGRVRISPRNHYIGSTINQPGVDEVFPKSGPFGLTVVAPGEGDAKAYLLTRPGFRVRNQNGNFWILQDGDARLINFEPNATNITQPMNAGVSWTAETRIGKIPVHLPDEQTRQLYLLAPDLRQISIDNW